MVLANELVGAAASFSCEFLDYAAGEALFVANWLSSIRSTDSRRGATADRGFVECDHRI
jgi:hypothetical protein